MNFSPYQQNTIVGPFLIVKCSIRGKFKKDVIYAAQWTCCEGEITISHADIDRKLRYGTVSCGPCEKQARRDHQEVKKRIHRAKPVEVPSGPVKVAIPKFDVPGAVDATGFIWPDLGRLGARWSAAELASKRPQAKGARGDL